MERLDIVIYGTLSCTLNPLNNTVRILIHMWNVSFHFAQCCNIQGCHIAMSLSSFMFGILKIANFLQG